MSRQSSLRIKIQRQLESAVAVTLLILLRRLPLRLLRALASLVGTILFLIPSVRKLCLANLAIAFPAQSPAWRRRTARRSLANLIAVFLEFFHFYKRSHLIPLKVDLSDPSLAKLRAARNSGQSLILLSMHMGNWEIFGLACSYAGLGSPISIARELKNPVLNRIMIAHRQSTGNTIVYEKGGARSIAKAFKAGKNVVMLVDQNTKTHQGGMFQPFFDLPATISLAPAIFARRFHSPIWLLHCQRTASGFKLIAQPVETAPHSYPDDDALSAAIMSFMQGLVERHPEEWTWFYRRWNTYPKDSSPELIARYPFYSTPDRHA